MKPHKQSRRRAFFSVVGIMLFFVVVFLLKRQLLLHELPKPNGLESLALQINTKDPQTVCREQTNEQRKFIAKVLDRYSDKILKFRESITPVEESTEGAIALGPIFLRKWKAQPGVRFDKTVWSWSDAFIALQKTQENRKDKKQWVSVDSSAKFLLEQDAKRVLQGKLFHSIAQATWTFRPKQFLRAVKPHAWQIRLNAGDFEGQKAELKARIEDPWALGNRKLNVEWVNDKDAYRFVADPKASKSYTDHRRKEIHLKRIIGANVIAHEVGHVIGFDDHYYEVWHDEYCYYTQEFDTQDIMSDAENGIATEKHWKIIEQAYAKNKALAQFEYKFAEL